MGQIKLLDCTLRDGGYINDWNFGHDTIVSVFERLVDAGICRYRTDHQSFTSISLPLTAPGVLYS